MDDRGSWKSYPTTADAVPLPLKKGGSPPKNSLLWGGGLLVPEPPSFEGGGREAEGGRDIDELSHHSSVVTEPN